MTLPPGSGPAVRGGPRALSADDQPIAVPHRITVALDSRGMHGPAVDDACGVIEPAVDKWETGDERPTLVQLVRLATLTGYPVEFFTRPVKPEDVTSPVTMCRRGGRGRGCQTITPDPPVLAPKRDAPFTAETLW